MKRVFAVLLFLPMMAHAEFMTGNNLLEKQRSSSVVENMVALGYVQGVFDASQSVSHCASGAITAGQVNDLVRQYLELYPSIRNKTADVILTELFKKTWPCANNRNQRGVVL